MIAIFLKEIRSYFSSLIAYVVVALFLTGIGLYTWVFGNNVFEASEAQLYTLFEGAPYFFMFLIPAITMRSIAEEKNQGTLELLMTKPITDWQIVLGKYLACVTLVILCLLPTVVYYYSIVQLGNPVGNIDSAVVIGSYIGLILVGAVMVAVGIFSSTLTSDQVIAFILGVLFCFVISEGMQQLSILLNSATIQEMGLFYQYSSISVGVVDTRNLIYMLSTATAFLLGAKLVLSSRKW